MTHYSHNNAIKVKVKEPLCPFTLRQISEQPLKTASDLKWYFKEKSVLLCIMSLLHVCSNIQSRSSSYSEKHTAHNAVEHRSMFLYMKTSRSWFNLVSLLLCICDYWQEIRTRNVYVILFLKDNWNIKYVISVGSTGNKVHMVYLETICMCEWCYSAVLFKSTSIQT